ncbi:hypothetical protein J8A87_25985 [Vibrio parahaemolyticus]|uniref:hypothetical protein n=1 Tax=Vibrio natriegens TaxID=691 RepID=UPI003D9FEEB9|nr:hypothetical protein [Vibrio parahaemolyticus]
MKYYALIFLALCFSAFSDASVPNNDSWIVVETEDEFTDKVSVNGSIIAKHDESLVVLMCVHGNTNIGLLNGAYDLYNKKYMAKVRVDNDVHFETEALSGSGGRLHVLTNNSEWKDKFAKGDSAIIQTKGWDNKTKTIRFKLNEFDKVYSTVDEYCR